MRVSRFHASRRTFRRAYFHAARKQQDSMASLLGVNFMTLVPFVIAFASSYMSKCGGRLPQDMVQDSMVLSTRHGLLAATVSRSAWEVLNMGLLVIGHPTYQGNHLSLLGRLPVLMPILPATYQVTVFKHQLCLRRKPNSKKLYLVCNKRH